MVSRSKEREAASPRAQMRQPFPAKGIHGNANGHFYINGRSIDVYGIGVRITRQQLQAALDLMGKV